MKNWISLLSGLLIAQLVLAVSINLTGEDYAAYQAEEKLLVFNSEKVDGVRIEAEAQSLLLQKQDGRWLLPENGSFPADQNNAKRLLDKLAALEKGWPVATTSGAARRFKVAEDEYQGKLSLLSGDDSLAELYVGTSPGFRKVHVRPGGEDAVYRVAFNSWEASAKLDDWIDKEILKLEASGIERIEMPGYVLQKEGEELKVADLRDQEEADEAQISTLLNKLTGLRIHSLLGQEARPEYQQDAPVLEIQLARSGAKPLTYRFSKRGDEGDYVLKRSDLEHYFKIPEYSLKPILEATRDKLVLSKAAAEESMVKETGETEDHEQEDHPAGETAG